jgi:hypothetical protein
MILWYYLSKQRVNYSKEKIVCCRKKYGIDFIDAILGLDHHTEDTSE